MKFIDLFAGIGGFRLGMEMAGHECVGHCEIDKFANASYIAMHNPKESEWYEADITRVRTDDIPRADCWCFGFPCQDISVAGKQGGFTRGKRSSLFFAVTGLIRNLEEEDRPVYLFIENVKNLLSINRGFDFAKILIELDEIGYDAEWQVLNSKHFGVPQNRDRVFIIGHLRGRGGREIFPINTANGEADRKVKQIAQLFGTKKEKNPSGGRVYATDGVMRALGAGHGMSQPYIMQLPHGYNKGGMKDICPTITKNAFENNNFVVKIPTPDGVSKTVRSSGRSSFDVQHSWDIVNDGEVIRRLTPRECFRLQGFPDEYFDRAAAVNSDTQLYKQAGNSVTVNVIYEIAKHMEI